MTKPIDIRAKGEMTLEALGEDRWYVAHSSINRYKSGNILSNRNVNWIHENTDIEIEVIDKRPERAVSKDFCEHCQSKLRMGTLMPCIKKQGGWNARCPHRPPGD